MNYYIKESEWEIIFAKLQEIKGIHTQNETITRRFVEAAWYMTRSGCQREIVT